MPSDLHARHACAPPAHHAIGKRTTCARTARPLEGRAHRPCVRTSESQVRVRPASQPSRSARTMHAVGTRSTCDQVVISGAIVAGQQGRDRTPCPRPEDGR